MPNVTVFQAIPDPNPDLNSLFQTVKALKQNMDLLVGGGGDSVDFSIPRLYMTKDRPTDGMRKGDLWVGPGNILYIYRPNAISGAYPLNKNATSKSNGWQYVQVYIPPSSPLSHSTEPTHGGQNH